MKSKLFCVTLMTVVFSLQSAAKEGNVKTRVTTSFVVRSTADNSSVVTPARQQTASLFQADDEPAVPKISTGYASMKKAPESNRFFADVVESADQLTTPSSLFDQAPMNYHRPSYNQRVSFERDPPQGPPISLFETEASYVDPPGVRPPGVRPSGRPATSVFNSFRPVTVNREPQPPAPPDDELPLPPAAPVALIQQSDGQLNQVSLTWAQLQAMLTPSTDLNGIINSITSAGSRLPAPVGQTFVTVPQVPGPPAPPVQPGPPVQPSPPAPPSIIQPPSVIQTTTRRPSIGINPIGALGALGQVITNPVGALGSAITNPVGTLGSIFTVGSPPAGGYAPSGPYGQYYGSYSPADSGSQQAAVPAPSYYPQQTFQQQFAPAQAPAGPTIIILTGKTDQQQQQFASAFASNPLPQGPPVPTYGQSSDSFSGFSAPADQAASAPPAPPAVPLPPSPPTILPPAPLPPAPTPPPLPPSPPSASFGAYSIPPADPGFRPSTNTAARNPSTDIIYGSPSAPASPPQRLPSYVIGSSPSFSPQAPASSYSPSFQDPIPSNYGSFQSAPQPIYGSFQSAPPSSYGSFQSAPQPSYGSFQSAPPSSYGNLNSPPSFSPPTFNPPSFSPSFKAPKSKGNFKSKEKFKGKKQSLFDKLKGNDQAVRSPSNTYGPPPEQSNDEPAGDDPLDDDTFPSQPQLSINYDYKYRGPPIMTKDSKGEKGIKKLTKLLYKGIVLLGGLGALTAAPIVPAVLNGRKRRHLSRNSTSLFDSTADGSTEPIPLQLKMALSHYMPPKATITDAECLQKSFCENLLEIDHSPYRDSLLFFYSV